MNRCGTPIITNELCSYGCGSIANYINKSNKYMCLPNASSCPANKRKNSDKIKQAHKDGKIPGWNELSKTANLNRGWSKGKNLVPNSEVFVENSRFANELVKKRIIKDNLMEYKCNKCSINSWQGISLVLELDHINGKNKDHRLENLRFLCPNCHSQTETYKGRNKNSGKVKVTDEELLTGYKICNNIRNTLLHLGLAPKGANYKRLKKLLADVGT